MKLPRGSNIFQGVQLFLGGGGGSTFSRGRGVHFFQGGSNSLFPIETHLTGDFPGGVWAPCPPPPQTPPGSALGTVPIFLPYREILGEITLQELAFLLDTYCDCPCLPEPSFIIFWTWTKCNNSWWHLVTSSNSNSKDLLVHVLKIVTKFHSDGIIFFTWLYMTLSKLVLFHE